jgi:translation initiation factor IF-1
MRTMNSEKAIQLEGTIMMVLPGTMFRVALANDRLVLAHISGKMRKRFIRLTIGDRVKMEMSPYDTAQARIVYRLWDADKILFWSAATGESKDWSQHQKLARPLSVHVKTHRYRKDDRGEALANGDSEDTKVHLCALRQRSYLDKEGCCSWPPDINGPITKTFSGKIRKSGQRRTWHLRDFAIKSKPNR